MIEGRREEAESEEREEREIVWRILFSVWQRGEDRY
jgi:hypothetical protein